MTTRPTVTRRPTVRGAPARLPRTRVTMARLRMVSVFVPGVLLSIPLPNVSLARNKRRRRKKRFTAGHVTDGMKSG